MSVKKKILYIVSFLILGVIIGVGYWAYTVGSANVWNGKGTVEKKDEGTVKGEGKELYVEVYVDKYVTQTGTLVLDGNNFYVLTRSGTIAPDASNVIAIKSQTGRIITQRNARWYRNKTVSVIVKVKEKLLIYPDKATDVVFIDPVSGKKIPADKLAEYKGKQIIVVRKITKPAVWLVAGIDSRNGILYGHNDSVMLLFINPKTSSITILSIPRDTIVYIPRLKSYTKLAHAFIYSRAGDPQDGARSLIETLEYNFGVHIDRYIIFSFKGVADVIDAIGGIDVHLDKRICCHSHDWACRGGTCLGPGEVHLDGRKFLVFWRSRTSDIERVERQMKFLTSPDVKNQVMEKLSLSLADELMKIWGNEIVSDTSPDKWIKLAYDIRDYHIRSESLKVYDVWGCYAADLTVEVSALKYDDAWLKDFYIKVFGPELASEYIKGIHPDRTVGQLGHCVKPETPSTSTTSTQTTGTQTQTSSPSLNPSGQSGTQPATTTQTATEVEKTSATSTRSSTVTETSTTSTATISTGTETSVSTSSTSTTATGGTP
ncbi:MAG: LCP family protein [Dictyoglomi bacterium]|nr:LCP family protein [Dictyoglomota bacterium]